MDDKPKRYLLNERGRTLDAAQVIERFFPDRHYGTRVPAHESAPWQDWDGVRVAYLTTSAAQVTWATLAPKKRGMAMRAIAECPICDKIVALSRINQHAIIHDPKTFIVIVDGGKPRLYPPTLGRKVARTAKRRGHVVATSEGVV